MHTHHAKFGHDLGLATTMVSWSVCRHLCFKLNKSYGHFASPQTTSSYLKCETVKDCDTGHFLQHVMLQPLPRCAFCASKPFCGSQFQCALNSVATKCQVQNILLDDGTMHFGLCHNCQQQSFGSLEAHWSTLMFCCPPSWCSF